MKFRLVKEALFEELYQISEKCTDARLINLFHECIQNVKNIPDLSNFSPFLSALHLYDGISIDIVGWYQPPTSIVINYALRNKSDYVIKSVMLHEIAHYIQRLILLFALDEENLQSRKITRTEYVSEHGKIWRMISDTIQNYTHIQITERCAEMNSDEILQIYQKIANNDTDDTLDEKLYYAYIKENLNATMDSPFMQKILDMLKKSKTAPSDGMMDLDKAFI